ncbi:MAG: tetratricopeptide repeat protein [Microscillaceae bacterium]|nr:tetratricopeptide repeat protein [Microscillaceae bacterium]MDW8460882.1 tetratricopeptide repeat protein [Cytophagales bacterium]
MPKNLFLSILLLGISQNVLGQVYALDSLKKLLQRPNLADTTRILASLEYAFEVRYTQLDTLPEVAKICLQKAQQIKFEKGIALSYYIQGVWFSLKANYEKALELYFKALHLAEKIQYASCQARIINNVAIVYYYQKRFNKAREFLYKSLKINQQINNLSEIARCYNNLGRLDFEEKKYLDAIQLFEKAIQTTQKIKSRSDFSIYYCNFAETSLHLNSYTAAVENAQKALKSALKAENKRMIARSKIVLGAAYFQLGKFQEAQKLLDDGTQAIRNINLEDYIVGLEYSYKLYEKLQNFHKAYDLLKTYKIMTDSLTNLDNYKVTLQKEYEYNENKIRMEQIRQEEQRKAERKQEKIIRVAFIIGLCLLSGMLFFAFRSIRIKARALNIISQQKQEIEQQKEEILQQQQELLGLNESLEAQQKNLQETYQKLKLTTEELGKSIKYASHLQALILPEPALLKQFFNDFFIIYLPKDVVSGDFYWFSPIDKQKAIFALADCTGHGVPGAFMSMLGSTILHELVTQKSIYNPSQILKSLNDSIVRILKQDQDRNHDGMDISVLFFNKQTNCIETTFAGSKSKMYLSENQKFTIIKGDRVHLGGSLLEKDFTDKTFYVSYGSIFYLLTDGFADQNNAERKRLGNSIIEQTLQKYAQHPLEKQKEILLALLKNHQQNEKQRDDISFIGLKL